MVGAMHQLGLLPAAFFYYKEGLTQRIEAAAEKQGLKHFRPQQGDVSLIYSLCYSIIPQ